MEANVRKLDPDFSYTDIPRPDELSLSRMSAAFASRAPISAHEK
jgi:hypothetical protein